MAYLTGRSSYPPPDPWVGGGAFSVFSLLYPRGPSDFDGYLRVLPADGVLPSLPGWRWIHTPGHTPGHVSFFREDDSILIAGDAFVTTRQESVMGVVGQRPELHGPPAYFTSDWDAAKLSVQRLADLEPNGFACGHGQPLVGPRATDALHWLADDFDRVARPSFGRYVRQPAVADERGVNRVPPPVLGPLPKAMLGAAAGYAIWHAIAKRRRAV